MLAPLYVRELTQAEKAALEAALRSKDAFTLRRAQIVLASAQGHAPSQIARQLHCAVQTVRNGIHAFEERGSASLQEGSSRPKSAAPVLDAAKREQLRALLHQSPRAYDKARSTWTLSLLAQVAHEQGVSETVLSIETVRVAVQRLGFGWKRAKQWITSPDAAYTRKKTDENA